VGGRAAHAHWLELATAVALSRPPVCRHPPAPLAWRRR
jgi:hypothetical protein